MGSPYHNQVPSPPGMGYLAPTEHVRREFAKRLQAAMDEKGWTQAELARRSSEHLPKSAGKKKITRDLISNYVRGLHAPRSHYLAAMCKALGKKQGELLPPGATPSAAKDSSPAIQSEQVDDGKMWLRVNAVLSWEAALEVMSIVKKDTEKAEAKTAKKKSAKRKTSKN